MRCLIRLLDRWLSDLTGLFEFSQHPDCILRLQLTRAGHTMPLGSQVVGRGEPVLALHFWNERAPLLPPGGADLAWALSFRRQLVFSFRAVAAEMLREPRLAHVRAVYGASALFSSSGHVGGTRMMQRLGFIVVPYHSPLGRFGEFWENLFSWWLMWAYNDPSLRSRHMPHLQRTEIWISAGDFLRRYGEASAIN